MAPKDAHVLLLGSVGMFALHGKMDFEDVIKVMALETEDYPGLPR